ncbi:MAG: DUF1850 domain-containing protein [Clostridia bacterium]|nr:DUF1850 domain-containing protein [Clostridia bacterium]
MGSLLRFRRFLFLLAFLALCLGTPVSWLTVVQADNRAVVWARPVRQGEVFYLRYTHSVTRRQVEDTYKLDEGNVVLTATRFEAVGAGLGYMGEGTIRAEKGWTVIEGMNRRLKFLPLRVGAVADHRLVYRGKEYHLWYYAPAYSLVHIGTSRGTVVHWLWWKYANKRQKG